MNRNWILSMLILMLTQQLEGRLLQAFYSGGKDGLGRCHRKKCAIKFFNCQCENKDWKQRPPHCIPISWLCDGTKDCPDGSDEIECICPQHQFQCSLCKRGGACDMNLRDVLYQCIPENKVNNGIIENKQYNFSKYTDCVSRKDEPKIFNRWCREEKKCNGKINCPWLTPNDEANCSSCPKERPNRCACNKKGKMMCKGRGYVCYSNEQRCNKLSVCTDTSDEVGCNCTQDEFKCKCYGKDPITCVKSGGCIAKQEYNDGQQNCPDKSDEIIFRNEANCGKCQLKVRRLSDITECSLLSSSNCDISTCYSTPSFQCSLFHCNITDVICTSRCNNAQCMTGFQCKDKGLALKSDFCDGVWNCLDGSDELRHQPGFKCVGLNGICVLPQINLYDDVAHCSDQSDLCFTGNGSCFQCLDKRLWISSKQVCDGVCDCYDYSDECLCKNHFNDVKRLQLFAKCKRNKVFERKPSVDNNRSFIKCQTKYGETTATLCDGQSECRDFSDECNCPNPPRFCNDSCHSFYPLGDRYCDGYEDQAWKYINRSECPKGFDERFCPNRFQCKAGDRISINTQQQCNGVKDCDNGDDELNCIQTSNKPVFSSDSEMIKHLSLRLLFWIMGLIVLCGNLFVIVFDIRLVFQQKNKEFSLVNTIIILNIAIADFVMGVYLITIAGYSLHYSGYYGQVDRLWRTSLQCSIIGSLAVISSETSCLLMVLMTIFRAYTLSNPFASLNISVRNWSMCVAVVWLVSLLVAFLPIMKHFEYYFADQVVLDNDFSLNGIWPKHEFIEFVCRLANLTNKTLEENDVQWHSAIGFLQQNFPQYVPNSVFGYYGETSVCLPKLFVVWGEHSWEFTFALISINFVCFMFIAISYVIIYKRSTNRSAQFLNKNQAKRDLKMQRRIVRIIATDFLCWIPICVMVFLSLIGVYIANIAYIVCACVLLPINSAFNPFLYSSLPDKIIFLFKRKSKVTLTSYRNSQQSNL